MGKHVEIENVGPIERIGFDLAGEGGVVVFRGRNGRGKSHAITAVASLADKARADNLTSRDGAEFGKIEGLGVQLTIGRRNRRLGELEVQSISAKEDVGQLVDPGKKDPAVADEVRMAVLCRLARVQPDPEAFASLFGGIDQLRAIAKPTTMECAELVPLAEAVRRDAQAAARRCEELAAVHGGKAQSLYDASKGWDKKPSVTQPLEDLQRERLIALERLRERRRNQLATIEKARQAKDALDKAAAEGAETETDEELQQREAAAAEEIRQLDSAAADVRDQIQKLRTRLAEIETLQARRSVDVSGLQQRRRLLGDRAVLVSTLRKQIADAQIPDADVVSEADVDRAVLEYTQAQADLRENHEAWAVFRKAAEAREQADREAAIARTNAQQADRYRDAAKGVDQIVSSAIAAVAPRGMGVKDGRLVVDTDRGKELFSELSAGERWRLALDVAIDAVGENGVVPIGQEAWEGLDPDNRAAIAEHARQREVWIVTAEADDGDLRAEVYSAETGT